MSVATGGFQATAASSAEDMTPDGRYVVFVSSAIDLTSEARPGVFRHDRTSGTTVFVGPGGEPSVSDDGQFVAFTSTADNLVPNDTNGVADVFIWSAADGSYGRATVVDGGQFGGGIGRISGDGRYVTYVTGIGVTGQARIHDRVLQTNARISDDGRPADVSADGRYAAFTSVHSEAPGSWNGRRHVYRVDRQTNVVVIVSTTSIGAQGDADSDLASMSDDGRYVVFYSTSTSFPGTRTGSPADVDMFVKDLDTGAIEQINLNALGVRIAVNSGFLSARISAAGRFVGFTTSASTVVPGDALGLPDTFLLDRSNGSIVRVSRAPSGAEAAGGASGTGIPSFDGRYVAFVSAAHNIVPGDTNFEADVFVRDMNATPPCRVTISPDTLAVVSNFGGTGSVSVTAPAGCTWTATANVPWIQLTSAETSSGNGAVTFNFDGYFGGTAIRSGAVVVNDAAYGLRQLPPTTQGPFGPWETPFLLSSTYSGAVPFTGWALDDVQVTRIRVNRLAVAGEGTGEIYIGDAVKVAGARPDVALLNPWYPYNTEAGWGLMVLTNMLPNQGNGTFTFRVHYDDAEGQTVSQTRTLTIDNASATVPFGTIDTPAQGQTVSGTIVNFGWALTPQSGTIPANGSTIDVYIDGVKVGNPTYGQFRSDIATLFPGYANSNGAVGYFIIDTTQYADGVHTIAWVVTDNLGRASGIGSRYFTIQNGPNPIVPPFQRRK